MKRREFLKTTGFSLMGLAAVCLGCSSQSNAPAAVAPATAAAAPATAAATASGGKKILIAYFSWSGNTKAVAEEIQRQVGGDLVQVTPAEAYSSTYSVTVAKAKQEQIMNTRPAITTKIDNMDQYDTVFIGYPNWWGSLPMAMHTFIEGYKWQGKTVIPFFTHGGGGVQNCMSHLEPKLTGANVQSYLCLSGSSAKSSSGEISSWLKDVKI